MDQAELESLVIRLVGDVSGYVKAMDQAVKHTEEAATKIEHSAAHVEKFHVRLKEFGERTEKTLLRVGLAVGAWEAFEKADRLYARHLDTLPEGTYSVLAEDPIFDSLAEFHGFARKVRKASKAV